MSVREVKESPDVIGKNEVIAFAISDVTPYGTNPTNLSCRIITWPESVDVGGDLLSGSEFIDGLRVVSPLVSGITVGQHYRLYWQFDDNDGNTHEPYLELIGEE